MDVGEITITTGEGRTGVEVTTTIVVAMAETITGTTIREGMNQAETCIRGKNSTVTTDTSLIIGGIHGDDTINNRIILTIEIL